MTAATPLANDYAEALRAYLEHPDELGLTAAYQLGRRAVNDGAGVLELLAAHARATAELLDGGADRVRRAATDFLYECIAPLEMAYRGFIEAHNALRQMNIELENTVAQRTAQLDQALRDLEAQNTARWQYAREVNDSIVQVLVAAEMAADLGHTEESRQLLARASQAARSWIGQQLQDAGPLLPGALLRVRSADQPSVDDEAVRS